MIVWNLVFYLGTLQHFDNPSSPLAVIWSILPSASIDETDFKMMKNP